MKVFLLISNSINMSLNLISHRHLARNPFICDCNLRWLAEYLHKNPIETSGARCESPKRMHRRRIEALRDDKFKCKWNCSCLGLKLINLFCIEGSEEQQTRASGECRVELECPAQCHCDRTTVDCSGRGLKEIPRDIPLYTTELLLNNNELERIPSDGLFGRLPNLVKLDLHRNFIARIEQNAFEGASKITELLLSGNKISEIHNKMFLGLHALKTLSLYDNMISCVMPGSFDYLMALSNL